MLAVRGEPKHLTSPCIAIVGARNASVAGRKMAAMLAQGLGDADFVVVSGLARGIDAAAHEAALSGGTVAVFAGGIDIVYPPENVELFERILAPSGAASARCASAGSRGRAISRAATGSSPAWRSPPSSWRRPSDPAR